MQDIFRDECFFPGGGWGVAKLHFVGALFSGWGPSSYGGERGEGNEAAFGGGPFLWGPLGKCPVCHVSVGCQSTVMYLFGCQSTAILYMFGCQSTACISLAVNYLSAMGLAVTCLSSMCLAVNHLPAMCLAVNHLSYLLVCQHYVYTDP